MRIKLLDRLRAGEATVGELQEVRKRPPPGGGASRDPADGVTDPATDVPHPLFARVYALLSARADAAGAAEHRRRLLEGLSGRVLDLGAGNGLNFAHYPAAVTEVVALEPEPHLRRLAIAAAAAAPVPVTVWSGTGEAIPAADGAFDHAVAALVLCSVGDPPRVLSELRRVVAPGGSLRYYEHVGAPGGRTLALQRTLDATLWPRLAGGCHLTRNTGAAIRAAGFTVVSEVQVRAPAGVLARVTTHLLGVAIRD